MEKVVKGKFSASVGLFGLPFFFGKVPKRLDHDFP